MLKNFLKDFSWKKVRKLQSNNYNYSSAVENKNVGLKAKDL